MLTLGEAQWQALQQSEARQFVAAVCDAFLGDRPEMRDHPGREEVLKRMQHAYDYAARTGFTSTPHIVQLMYLTADAARIHDDPLVDRYLRKPGATPEQRLDDLNAVMKQLLKGDR
ncbi:hypothetical protein HBH1_03469 [Herbaspirillum sp. BH-1]|uniref:Uncharacterized protein n=1 Tax=Herbaspirillum frisingense TaxID=92645 RepID=A0ABU1P9S5_9BURK|nr:MULTISPECIES: hypothetical protein [Herbaspirillum]MDR6582671.1 hypothetical protein [Herbaspirillum frisingense]PLY58144.1 hypothetical protein HBH1_03469 [Herbaspirillum sp. BH-1]